MPTRDTTKTTINLTLTTSTCLHLLYFSFLVSFLHRFFFSFCILTTSFIFLLLHHTASSLFFLMSLKHLLSIGPFPVSFLYFVCSKQLRGNEICRWLDSNCGSLVCEPLSQMYQGIFLSIASSILSVSIFVSISFFLEPFYLQCLFLSICRSNLLFSLCTYCLFVQWHSQYDFHSKCMDLHTYVVGVYFCRIHLSCICIFSPF